MTPWLDDRDVRLYHGDAIEVLRELPDASVDCCVTSPPYWGLRDYGTEGQIGLEETPDLFVANMVAVFREVRRVLAPHGTCWVNLGDSYAGVGYSNHENTGGALRDDGGKQRHTLGSGLKPKDLVGMPWRVAFALQADGWYLRSDIIWAKPNPMPESVTDRPTKAHEYVFLLTRQPRYWFDAEAVRERYTDPREGGEGFRWHSERYTNQTAAQSNHEPTGRGPDGRKVTKVEGRDGSEQHRNGERWPNPAGRNVRSVWTIATQPYPEAHFATFPEELARRCIVAGCPERVCRECGKPSERIVERGGLVAGPSARNHVAPYEWKRPDARDRRVLDTSDMATARALAGHIPGHQREVVGESWSDCGHNQWRPGTVLDPFIGSGTTAKVARDHARHAIGIDLSAEYLELAARRLQQLSLLTGADA